MDRGAVQYCGGLVSLADRLERPAGEPERIGIGPAPADLRFQHLDGIVSAARQIERTGEEILRLPVFRLDRDQTVKLVDRGVIIAFAMLDDALDQQHGGYIVDHALGLLHQPSRQAILASAGGKHCLHEKRSRIMPVEGNDLAGDDQHVGHPPHVAEGRRIFGQQRHIIGVDLQRALEPGNSGPQTKLETQQFAAILQGANIARIQLHRLVDRVGRSSLIAGVGAKARNRDPQIGIFWIQFHGPVERGTGQLLIAHLHRDPAHDARRITLVAGGNIIGEQLVPRLFRFALQKIGVAVKMANLRRVETKLDGPVELRLGGKSVHQTQQYLGLRHARIDPLRIRLDRIHQFNAGRPYIAARAKFLRLGKGFPCVRIALAGTIDGAGSSDRRHRQRRGEQHRLPARAPFRR